MNVGQNSLGRALGRVVSKGRCQTSPGLLGLLFVLMLSLLGSSCGYKLASEEPSVLGKGNSTLKIKRINNPTLYVWLSHQMRTIVHDEVQFRQLGKWVDSGKADYELEVNILQFGVQDCGYSREGESVMFSANMQMEINVYDGSSNQLKWQSGVVSLSRVYDTDNSREASQELATELIRRCLDRMRFVF